MQDAFAILQLPRRPWLEESDVRSAFQRVAARMHPDATTGSVTDFAELTKAYQTVREPAMRLRHLLTLEVPGSVAATVVPPELMTLFPTIANVRQGIDDLKQRRAEDAVRVREEAKDATGQLAAAMNAAIEELRRIDAEWPSHESLRALPLLQARLAFLEKWQSQLREALLQLDIGSI